MGAASFAAAASPPPVGVGPAAPVSAFARWFPWGALLGAALLGLLALVLDARARVSVVALAGVDIEIFVQPGCPHCEAAQAWLAGLSASRPALVIQVRDVVGDREALRRLRDVVLAAGARAAATPALLVRGTLVVGWRDADSTGARVTALLAAAPRTAGATDEGGECPLDLDAPAAGAPAAPCATAAPEPGEEVVDLPVFGRVRARDVGLPLFTVVLGLVDGFNPCAMWVLLFLLSLLVNLRSRARMLAIAGTFLVASGVCYFAFMAAWLSFFDVVGQARVVQVVLGMAATFVAAIHVKDFFAFHQGLTFSIPEGAKPGLYARVTRVLRANRLTGAMLGVVVLAFLVNTVELLCTAGLPAVYTGVLSRYGLPRWQEYAYIGLYQVFYMLDDAIMLAIAVITLSRRRLQEGGGRWLKLISGAVVGALGLLLLFQPRWLYW